MKAKQVFGEVTHALMRRATFVYYVLNILNITSAS